MHNRRAERARKLDQLGVCAATAATAHHGDALAGVEQGGELVELTVARPHDGRSGGDPARRLRLGGLERNVARDHHHRHAALGHRDADRLLEDAGQVINVGNQLHIMRALGEQVFRMGRLEIMAADLLARDVRGDRQHRHAAAIAVEQAIDQVQVARPAAAGADRELAGEVRLGTGGEGAGFLVAHVHPFDRLVPAQRIGDAVQ